MFANELCDLFQRCERADVQPAMLELLARFGQSVEIDVAFGVRLVEAVYDKLTQFAPIFEINVSSSAYCKAIRSWLDMQARAA